MKPLYATIHSFGVIVNPGGAVPLVLNRLGVDVIIITASIGNAGIIYVGGPTCTPVSGQELDAGKGILLTAAGSFAFQEMMESALGSGLNLNMRGAYAPIQGPPVLIAVDQIFVTASIAAQNLRCLYLLPVHI